MITKEIIMNVSAEPGVMYDLFDSLGDHPKRVCQTVCHRPHHPTATHSLDDVGTRQFWQLPIFIGSIPILNQTSVQGFRGVRPGLPITPPWPDVCFPYRLSGMP